MNEPVNHSIDALLPREMAAKAEHIGVDKTRLDTMSLIALAVLAGAFIALTTPIAGRRTRVALGFSRANAR